jgi:hypothetical protein
MQFQFANPGYLYLLWLAPALAAWWVMLVRRRHRALDAFLAPAMQRRLCPPTSTGRDYAQIVLFALALLLMLLAIARPRWGEREETALQAGRDLMICLDVSRSMLAADVHPNRLRRAKTDILDLIHVMRGDRVGLIAFRNKGAIVCPMTTDYAFIKQALDGVDIDSAPPGETDIGDALRTALEAFDAEDASTKAIILISDGEDLTGKAIELAREAGEKKIPVFTVGLGDSQGARIPDAESTTGFQQFENEAIVSRLDHNTLHRIATASGGVYWPLELASTARTTLGTLYQEHVRKIKTRELAETRHRRAIERYQWFLLPALVCALAAMFLSRGRLALRGKGAQPTAAGPTPPHRSANAAGKRGNPPPASPLKHAALLLALGLWALTRASADAAVTNPVSAAVAPATNATEHAAAAKAPPGRRGAREAQRLYRKGDYAAAAAAYRAAAQGTDYRTAAIFTYNAALAHYAAGDYSAAAELLRGLVLRTRDSHPGAAAALGAALYRSATHDPDAEGAPPVGTRAALMRQAADAFRQALRRADEEGDRTADAERQNLAAAMRDLPRLDEEAKLDALMTAHGQKAPAALTDELLQRQRSLLRAVAQTATNTTPARVYALEALAAEQRSAADLWLPLRAKLAEALAQSPAATNVQLQAAMNQLAEQSRQDMLAAAERLRDLDLSGQAVAARAEQGVYQLWKSLVPYERLLAEDRRRQTNALATVRGADAASGAQLQEAGADQSEALALTPLFRERFDATVPPEGIPAPPPTGTNAPPDEPAPPLLSAEDRAKILELADGVAVAQRRADEALQAKRYGPAAAEQETAAELLAQIRELLPKQPPQHNPQPQTQPPQQPEPQPQDQPQPEDPQDKPQPEDPQDKPEPEEQPEEQLDASVEQILEKALEREREHEAEKRRRNRMIRFRPSARDW